MSEDINEELPPIEETEQVEETFEVEFTTNAEYITSAVNSYMCVDGIDLMMLTKEEVKRVNRIRRKSLRIIDACIGDLYDELFEKEDDDN